MACASASATSSSSATAVSASSPVRLKATPRGTARLAESGHTRTRFARCTGPAYLSPQRGLNGPRSRQRPAFVAAAASSASSNDTTRTL
eukprot:scaffold656708_cov46-Prasinocladus_malaysianus.AAC.1